VCWDNAAAESFFASLKKERTHRTVYPTRKLAISDVTRYIETALQYPQNPLRTRVSHPARGLQRVPDTAAQRGISPLNSCPDFPWPSSSGRRYRDTHISVSLAPWTKGSKADSRAMFVATIRWEYRSKVEEPLRFVCVSDPEEYRAHLDSPTDPALVWNFEPVDGLTADDSEAFEVLQVAVDGRQLPARRVTRAGSQTYKVDSKHLPGDDLEHVVSYTFRVLVQRKGHVLRLDIAKPTKGLRIDFAYGGCGIQRVKLLDYFGSVQRSRVARVPESSVAVSFDGWVDAKGWGGVCLDLEKS
jgi:hypothetical protein